MTAPLGDAELLQAMSINRMSPPSVMLVDRLITQAKGGNALAEVLRHALELGYFSEGGSTERWARDVLKDYDEGTT